MLYNNHIHIIRESKGISLTHLEKNLGVTRSTLYRWEAGESKVSKRYWSKLAAILHCRIEELFDIDKPETELTTLANQIEQILQTNKLLVSNKPLYYQQELLIRSLGNAFVQAIHSTGDINELHKKEAIFTMQDYERSKVPEIDFK